MGDATKLAVSILIMLAAGVCFFVAFHPGGVMNVSDPDTMLEWLSAEFTIASEDPSAMQESNVGEGVDVNVANAKNGSGTPEQTVRGSVSPSNG